MAGLLTAGTSAGLESPPFLWETCSLWRSALAVTLELHEPWPSLIVPLWARYSAKELRVSWEFRIGGPRRAALSGWVAGLDRHELSSSSVSALRLSQSM